MSSVAYRLARNEDLETSYALFRTATNHLLGQRNLPLIPFSPTPPVRSMAFRRHALLHDAPRFWIAEADGRAVGFGIATLREHLWYLAALHVVPEWQGYGIGRELLRRCLAGAERTRDRIVISDTINPHSNALYARHGLFQRLPLIELSGPTPTTAVAGIDTIAPDAVPWDEIDRLDLGTLGVTRRIDHELWLAAEQQMLVGLSRNRVLVAYGYVSPAGVGPACAIDDEMLAELILGALTLSSSDTLRAVKLAGTAAAAITTLLHAGFKYRHVLLLNGSSELNGFDRYAVSVADALL